MKNVSRSLLSVRVPVAGSKTKMLVVGTPEYGRILEHHLGVLRVYETRYLSGIVRYFTELGIPFLANRVKKYEGENKYGNVAYAVRMGRKYAHSLVNVISGDYLGYSLPEERTDDVVMTAYTTINVPIQEVFGQMVPGVVAVSHVMTHREFKDSTKVEYSVDGKVIIISENPRLSSQCTVNFNVVNYLRLVEQDLDTPFGGDTVIPHALEDITETLLIDSRRTVDNSRQYKTYKVDRHAYTKMVTRLYAHIFNHGVEHEVILDSDGNLEARHTVIIHE